MSGANSVSLPLRVGVRTLWRIRRKLVRVHVPIGMEKPALPPLPETADGYLVTALPAACDVALRAERSDLAGFVRQRYRRSFASLTGSFDDYFGRFSGKTRSTLKRKVRKLTDVSGGALDLRCYAKPHEMAEFQSLARKVSALTYQERRFGAGLPEGEAALAEMRALAAEDSVRAWLLFLDGKPIAYLYSPAQGDTLLYLYLGYDPAYASWSPGTVLQLEAMRRLMEERRFKLFDFTEGEGRHKELFATGTTDCLDLLLVRPTIANLAACRLLTGFDYAVGCVRRWYRRPGRRGCT